MGHSALGAYFEEQIMYRIAPCRSCAKARTCSSQRARTKASSCGSPSADDSARLDDVRRVRAARNARERSADVLARALLLRTGGDGVKAQRRAQLEARRRALACDFECRCDRA